MRVVFVAVVAGLLAVSAPAESSSIEIILDASRSMTAPFEGNRTRIEGARAALEQVVGSLPPGSRVAFRAYGHQSPTSKHDCDDTALLLPFKPLDQNAKPIVAAANKLTVQGYTPITKVLGLAAKDFTAGDGSSHVLILISDGKETCGGDPCATAAALRKADVKLVIHTVGLGVDEAARSELRCIANGSGGRYYDAKSVTELAEALKTAANTPASAFTGEKKGRGSLHMLHAGLDSHIVRDSGGNQVAKINMFSSSVSLPAGVYSVAFGSMAWSGIEVRDKATTTIDPGEIEVPHLGPVTTVEIVDPETGSVVAKLQSSKSKSEVLPGIYDLHFSGGAVWPSVRADAGQKALMDPGIIHISLPTSVPIMNPSHQKVATANSAAPNVPLPPGEYIVKLPTGEMRVKLAAGQTIDLNKK